VQVAARPPQRGLDHDQVSARPEALEQRERQGQMPCRWKLREQVPREHEVVRSADIEAGRDVLALSAYGDARAQLSEHSLEQRERGPVVVDGVYRDRRALAAPVEQREQPQAHRPAPRADIEHTQRPIG